VPSRVSDLRVPATRRHRGSARRRSFCSVSSGLFRETRRHSARKTEIATPPPQVSYRATGRMTLRPPGSLSLFHCARHIAMYRAAIHPAAAPPVRSRSKNQGGVPRDTTSCRRSQSEISRDCGELSRNHSPRIIAQPVQSHGCSRRGRGFRSVIGPALGGALSCGVSRHARVSVRVRRRVPSSPSRAANSAASPMPPPGVSSAHGPRT